ncbi:PREDICTED: LOW QUALITY PROTEIN: olfactory receptor 51G2-like [Fulmarus glacialis]|uniref:LOW QUALITY PROTEIN: olfactory receptor 51G2-like n=1 Tax=Fulmarus glacialis TaxID=30455 RepID=UPI00051AB315|nr:PREDICTED: LOW QUALITY PROTEIN: olfactory receptor 51G2-like [Fulmarus glacialis]
MTNSSFLRSSTFLLTGIPGMESGNVWLAIPFCCVYVISILGNSAILFVIKAERSLHEPVYLFLCMLAIAELDVSLSMLPTVLSMLLCDSQIRFHTCLAQMFFICSFSIPDSGVLRAMAFDLFMAILQYAPILTNPRIGVIGLGFTVRSISLLLPLPILLKKLSFCRSQVLAHSFCLHPNLLQLPCADIKVNSMYGCFVILATFGLDLSILLSCAMIIKSVLSITSKEECLKALNTCPKHSHICAVLIYYIPMIGLSMAYRFGKPASPLIHVLMANIYFLVPPVLNPIIYSVKTKQIHRGIHKLLTPRRR